MEASSIKDRAAAGEQLDGDEQLFPQGSVEGDGVSLGKFIKPGKDNKLGVKIKAVRVPAGKGLADPDKLRTLLVSCQPGKVEAVPHMAEGAVDSYETVQHFTPTFVEGVQRGDAGRVEAMFTALLSDDSKGAAKALDAMQKKAREVIGA